MWGRLCVEETSTHYDFFMGWNLSEESGFRTWRLSCRKTLWICFFPDGGTPSKSIISRLCLTLDASARRVLPSSWCQEASAAAVVLSEGSGGGVPSHQGALSVDYVVFMAVSSWWSCIKMRQRREGWRPMDCSSLPSSRVNFHPVKWINQIWVVRVDVHTELFSPRTACLAVLSSPCTYGKVEEEASLESSPISGVVFCRLPRYPLTHPSWDWHPAPSDWRLWARGENGEPSDKADRVSGHRRSRVHTHTSLVRRYFGLCFLLETFLVACGMWSDNWTVEAIRNRINW